MKQAIYFSMFFYFLFFINCKDNSHTIINEKHASIVEPLVTDTVTHLTEKGNDINPLVRDTSKYYIYFTLDDGPFLPATKVCRDILEEAQVKTTFFMVGIHCSDSSREDLVNSINNNPLFLLANHSNTHAFRNKYKYFYNHPDKAVDDFLLAEKKLHINHKIIRLPGMNTWAFNKKIETRGSAISKNVAKQLDSLGYYVFGWDLEWKFTNGGTAPKESVTQMIKNVESKLKSNTTMRPKTIVILAHDRMFEHKQYADSLKKFITTLKENDNYIFDTLDNYPVQENISVIEDITKS